jgi:methylated-DNA-[protein]-cysteine S-methyltransferase
MPRRASAVFRTAMGWAGVGFSEKGILALVLPRSTKAAALRELGATERLAGAKKPHSADQKRLVRQLQRFFSGQDVSFDLPVDLEGQSDFRKAVWRAAGSIPYGETRSYGWIARRIGKPGAARAVGQAMGANPVPVLVP